MKKRVPRRAWYYGTGGRRPRVLIEDDHPAIAISDFSLFEQAGFDVAFCSGPGDEPGACPLMAGGDCPVAAHADAVLHGLDPTSGVAAAIRERYPAIPVLVTRGGPLGCIPLAGNCSVPGQIEALKRAVPRRGSSPGHHLAVISSVGRRTSRLRGRGSRRR